MDQKSPSQQGATQPIDISELKQIIKNRFSFDRRKMIFFTLNSCLLGLALFSLFSAITLESNAQIFRIRSYLILATATPFRQSCRTLETILIPQNLAQLTTVICAIIGYFGIYQKSKKILFMYPLSLGIAMLFRTVSTCVILGYYSTVQTVFSSEVNTFITLQVIFLVLDAFFSAVCYLQFKKSQVEFFIVSKDKERLITDNNMAYELIKKIVKN